MVDDAIPTATENEQSSTSGPVTRRRALQAIGGAGLAGTAGCLSQLSGGSTEAWPSRQVEVIVPWAAGGGSDRTSRAVADAAENHTDVSWNVSNQTGGSGSVGMSATANAEPAGHTLGCTAPEICLFQHLDIADLGPEDITPIMQYTQFPATVVVHEDSEYDTLDDFISYADSNPGNVKMGNSGTGSSWHLAGAAFTYEADIEVEQIPYDGASPAVQATMNKEVDCATVGAAEVASQVRDGPLKSLGVMFDEQLESLPNTPTMQEQGLDVVIGSWLAHFAPPGVPDDVQQSLVDTYEAIYEDDQFKQFMDNNNFRRVQRGPDELSSFLSERYEYYGTLVEELNIGE